MRGACYKHMDDENTFSHNRGQTNIFLPWRIIKKRRKFISIFVSAVVVLTVMMSLFLTDIYEARTIIMPVTPNETGGGISSSFMQQVGGMTGIAVPESASSAEIVTLLKSIGLREAIITKHNLLPVLFPDEWDKKAKTWRINEGFTLDPSLIARKLRPVDKKIPGHDGNVPAIWDGLRELDKTVAVISNTKEKTITISVESYDPVVAAQIAGYFLSALNEYMSGEAKRVAMINRKYLEEQLLQTADPYIKQKLYNMIAQQLETSMMAEVKENFAFKILDRPKVPDKKIKPKRALMVMLSLVASLLLSVFLVFFLEYLEKVKTQKIE